MKVLCHPSLLHGWYVFLANERILFYLSFTQSVADAETRRAMDAAEKKYDEAFDTSIQADESVLHTEHQVSNPGICMRRMLIHLCSQRCLALARMVFDEVAIGDDAIKKTYETKLFHTIGKRFDLFREKKYAEAAAQMDSMLMQIAADLTQVLHLPISSVCRARILTRLFAFADGDGHEHQ